MNKPETIIYWDKADHIFVAEKPGMKGCIAHGDTEEEAYQELEFVSEEWIKIAEEKEWQMPSAMGE